MQTTQICRKTECKSHNSKKNIPEFTPHILEAKFT